MFPVVDSFPNAIPRPRLLSPSSGNECYRRQANSCRESIKKKQCYPYLQIVAFLDQKNKTTMQRNDAVSHHCSCCCSNERQRQPRIPLWCNPALNCSSSLPGSSWRSRHGSSPLSSLPITCPGQFTSLKPSPIQHEHQGPPRRRVGPRQGHAGRRLPRARPRLHRPRLRPQRPHQRRRPGNPHQPGRPPDRDCRREPAVPRRPVALRLPPRRPRRRHQGHPAPSVRPPCPSPSLSKN